MSAINDRGRIALMSALGLTRPSRDFREGQGLSRALIEPQRNGVEVGLGEAREIGSSREVLSQQAVGVLVAATLPWTARITEVNLHVGGNREAFVARHLLALVPRQGAS